MCKSNLETKKLKSKAMTPPKAHNSSVSESKDTKIAEIPDK
jgi:hypothetical protein